ncbi:MAG: tRNA 4-thiouridine(8) synthase ThiI [Bacilli bacterium]|nr:tRNA 4-thiouridine(8) synthase ThiI [Bacilli bacterium]
MNNLYNHILIRYGELALKKSNRNQFIKAITSHIKSALHTFVNLQYESRGMRFYIMLNGEDVNEIIPILEKIPGIYSFSVVARCESNLDDIKDLALKIMSQEEYQNKTMKIETNRGDKNFPLTSLEVTKEIGRHLFRNLENLKADVHNPDITLDVDLRYEGTYIFTKTYYGVGGFPAGTLGKGLVMISGGIDSVVSGYLSLKKGIEIEAVHFASPPYTSNEALQKVVDLLEQLTIYSKNSRIVLHIVPFTKIQEAIYKYTREDYCITIMRRMMYRIATNIMHKINANVIINGESMGQVASQTLESMNVINEVTNALVIRPLAAFDKQDIIAISQKINTFDISIRPYDDCCTVYVPKHPQIKPKSDVAEKEENKFAYQEMIDEAVANTERVVLRYNSKYNVVKDDLDIL